MKYLQIQNEGILDIRLVALMGGTTKAKDEYKIGQFGTGLKYTLAFLFRNNLDFKIFSGTEEIKIHLEREEIRGDVFEIICINGHRTSITTKMGEDWKAWMICREIWCNALDEGGAAKDITDCPSGKEGTTTFCVQVDSQIQAVLNDWDKYFIHGQEPIFKSDTHAIYPGGPTLKFYKNGVMIDEKNFKSLFSYDILNAEINELREFKGQTSREVAHALASGDDKLASYFLENINDTYYEGGDMDYEWYQSWNGAWKTVIGSGKIIHQEALDQIEARGITIDALKLVIVPKNVYKALTKQFAGIGALIIASKAGEFYETWNAHTDDKIKQGLTILEACKYPMHPELKFIYGYFEDKSVQARVSLEQKKVYISNTMIQEPLVDIVSMLIEENEHFNTGLSDCSRSFQDHFIKLYTRELLAKNAIEI